MDDLAARNELVLANRRLVAFTLRKMGLDRHQAAADLRQIGMLGLIAAAEHYEPARGKFSTYAVVSVRRHVVQAAREWRRWLTLPVGSDGDTLDVADQAGESLARQKATRQRLALEAALARLPACWAAVLRKRFLDGRTPREVAQDLGLSRSRVLQLQARALRRLAEVAPELVDLID
jgi:RNA polymerase sigma factor (sigma-70 family)